MQWFLLQLLLLHGMVSNSLAEFTTSGLKTEGVCASLQYLYLGKEGSIDCSIMEDFYGVYWYNSTDSKNSYPFLSFHGLEKTGEGYNSGKYDVLPNGSLIIRNVSREDNHQFRVIILRTKDDPSIIYDISVYVVVRSRQPYPFIGVCGKQRFCFRQLPEHHQISCSVNGTRPAANLIWKNSKASTIPDLKTEVTVLLNNGLYMVEAKTNTSYEGEATAVLLLCQVTTTEDVIAIRESMVLIENTDMTFQSLEEKQIKIFNSSTEVILTCSGDTRQFIIWKKKTNDTWLTIGYVYFGTKYHSEVFYPNYTLKRDGSLVASFEKTDILKSFLCIYNDAEEDKLQAYEVVADHTGTTTTGTASSPVLVVVTTLVVFLIVVIAVLGFVLFIRRKQSDRKKVEQSDHGTTKDTKTGEDIDTKENTETIAILSSNEKEEDTLGKDFDTKENTETAPILSSNEQKVDTSDNRNVVNVGQPTSSGPNKNEPSYRVQKFNDSESSESETEEDEHKRLGLRGNDEQEAADQIFLRHIKDDQSTDMNVETVTRLTERFEL